MGWFNRKPRDLIADANAEADLERLAYARLHKNLDGLIAHEEDSHNALIASGGWCAPSQTVYDFFPEIQVKRGGIKWPTNP